MLDNYRVSKQLEISRVVLSSMEFSALHYVYLLLWMKYFRVNLVPVYQRSRRQVLQDRIFSIHRLEDLKSHRL
jgi:hypothetical protein